MTVWIQASEAAYFDSLWARRAEAQTLVYREVVFRNDARPLRHDCHANAARWAAETSDIHPVHGWLVEGAGEEFVRLSAHSVLQQADGGLYDITPLEPYSPAFLAHPGSAPAFFALLPRFNTLTWPVS